MLLVQSVIRKPGGGAGRVAVGRATWVASVLWSEISVAERVLPAHEVRVCGDVTWPGRRCRR